jgi:hypothetical protein
MPTYKINYSGGKARVINVNKLPNKTTLQSLDRVYLGQPFVNVVSKFQDTRGLDTAYLGQPFYGHTDGIAIPSSRISTTNHPDVTNWLNTVALNGGSASSSTIAALNTFCNSIELAGLRNKFYRLNLFCGNNLSSCRVPLFNAISYNNVQYGYDQDSIFNFSISDYSESSGLRSASTTGYLDTGVIAASFELNNIHMGVGILSTDTSTAVINRTLIGLQDGTSPQQFSLDVASSANAGLAIFGRTATSSDRFGDQGSSNTLGVRLGAGNIVASWPTMYRNGTSTGVTATTYQNYSSTFAKTIYVFALNLQGAAARFTDARLGWYSIGSSLTAQNAISFNAIINTFYSNISRT